ncbi:MAG: lysylphosphatidylglycerol synthase transmembrane domain-containing protein [Bacteroidales bacterium]
MQSESSPGRLRQAVVLVAKIVVSTALLYWLLHGTDLARLWLYARKASPAWLTLALGLFLAQLLVSAWRWELLLKAQGTVIGWSSLVASYLVANFFNNFLPSNIGGDVIRIRDSAGHTGSKTLATTVILFDRGIGLMGLILVAAIGATAVAGSRTSPIAGLHWLLWAGLAGGAAIAAPVLLLPDGVARLLQPLRYLHAEWVGERITKFTTALENFRQQPRSLAGCFLGAIVVQALLVGFYLAIAHSMHIPVAARHLAILVPVSFIVQMLPVSVNGFGVREWTFTVFFARFGIANPRESAVVVSFMGAALMMLFSLSGAAVYLARGARRYQFAEAEEEESVAVS